MNEAWHERHGLLKPLRVWQRMGFILTVFFSLSVGLLIANTAQAAMVGDAAHATYRIQSYLQRHPITIEAITRTQANITDALDQLSTLSTEAIIKQVNKEQPEHAELYARYPVQSNQLTPGHVITRSIHITLPTPFFIVGNDDFSIDWLRRYHALLAQRHAQGFVVHVNSPQAMQALQRQFPHLVLIPMPGNAVARWLKLAHYPVFISDQLIEQ